MTVISTKNSIVAFLAMTWVTLAPIHTAMYCVVGLPIVDLILALVCAIRAKRPITSAGLKRTVAKVFLYELATLIAFAAELYLIGPAIPAVKAVTGLIGITELKSCLEHLDELNGAPFFTSVLSRLAPPQPPEKKE